MKKRRPIKTDTFTSSIQDALSEAFGALQELAEECRSVVDNVSGTPLENVGRNVTLGETADTLEGISEPDVPDSLDGTVTYTLVRARSKRKGLPRQARCDNAIAIIETVISWLDDPEREDNDEAQTLRDELEEARENASSCEFPGRTG